MLENLKILLSRTESRAKRFLNPSSVVPKKKEKAMDKRKHCSRDKTNMLVSMPVFHSKGYYLVFELTNKYSRVAVENSAS